MEVNSKSGSNLRKVIWRIEILNAVDGNGEISKVTWRIENFSSFKNDQRLYSEFFTAGGNLWIIIIYPKGYKNNEYHLSVFLRLVDLETSPSGCSKFVQFGFAVIDQIDRTNSITQVDMHTFNATRSAGGFHSFLALSELNDPERGYLVNDAFLVEAYISTDRTIGLISRELILKTDSDKHKTKEADGVKAAIDNQATMKTEPVEITVPSPTQSSCQIVANEPAEPTEEDIMTFFTSLESELSSCVTVFSKEEAKEALAKLEEALNMTPLDFYDSGEFSSLKQAFKILLSFDCSSTTGTIEQKNKLLAMEESLKELADQAMKAVLDKSRHTEKESIKLTITRNLDRNLIRYKEMESEVKQVEQKLAALLAERKGIFRSSKEMRIELEALGQEWAEYEANAKAAEAGWGRMKDFISSIKGRI
ncbi:hypothetical protein V6N11_054215 [Hibiscus sabdariffa]|uniref:MATH domain-containing protein n=1 Tax=Hibiscus sabdariffa TaxID=183260 RepID=A0ABR2S388_9ROSI